MWVVRIGAQKSAYRLRAPDSPIRNYKNPSRLVYGVASLPLGTPIELELIFEVSD
jgi:hypothetical protein